jgi:hypothetical protein
MANGINKKFFDFDLLKRVLRFAAPYKRRFYWSIALANLHMFGSSEQLFTKRKTLFFNKVDWASVKLLLTFIWQAF